METQQPPPDITPQIKAKLATIQTKLPAMYRDFERTYVAWQTHPENAEYQHAFENLKLNLKAEETALAAINGEVAAATAEINHKLIALKRILEAERTRNRRLQAIQTPSTNAYQASKTRIDDYAEAYKLEYAYNLALLVGIIALLFLAMRAGSYEFKAPSLGGALAAFVVYLVIILAYIYRYGVNGWLFILLIVPFFFFAVGLFVRKTSCPTCAA